MTFSQVDAQRDDLIADIDAAYRAKYARYGETYLQPMLAEQAVAATLRLDPQTTTLNDERK